MKYWLMKTEPNTFSFSTLLKNKEEFWDGVRNYQARNFMRDDMSVGDQILIYHSNASPSGIAGLAEVIKPASPDLTAFDPKSDYFDEKSKKDKITWVGVTVGKPKEISRFLSLEELKKHSPLKDMLLLRKGQRLSIMPVTQKEFEFIIKISSN